MSKKKFSKYKFYLKNKPSTFKTETEEFFEQRSIYENNLKIAWAQLFIFPSQTIEVEGGFWYSFYIRAIPFLKEDYYHFKNFYKSHFYKRWTLFKIVYVVLLWILLLPPLYYIFLTLRYIIWRLSFYLFCFLESFFQNFIFKRFCDPKEYTRLNYFYYKILLNSKGFLIDSWGLGFFRKLFALPLKGFFFVDFVWRKKGRPHWERFLFYIVDWERRLRFMQSEIEEVGLFPYLIGLDTFYKGRRFYRQYRFLIILNKKGRKWVYAFGLINRNYIYRNGRIIRLHFLAEWMLLPWRLYKYFWTKYYSCKYFFATLIPTIEYHLWRPLPYVMEYGTYIYRVLTVVPIYIINYIVPLKNNKPTFEYLRRKSFTLTRKTTAAPGLINHKLRMASRNPYYTQRIKRLQAIGALPRYADENDAMGWLFFLVLLIFIVIIIYHINIIYILYLQGFTKIHWPFVYYSVFIL